MDSEEASCSECKIELVQKKWTDLLLNWLNKCVNPNKLVKEPNARSLVDIINKYKHDICDNDMDRAILCTDDLEPFLRYKYPILRLRYFTEDKDTPKKLYIMTSVLLFHCCISSITGDVIGDICQLLEKGEQEVILRFCEGLSTMEITLNNVESAIREACEVIPYSASKTKARLQQLSSVMKSRTSNISDSTAEDRPKTKKYSTLKFKSSVTVLPSYVSENNGSFSKTSLHDVSSLDTSDYTMSYSSKLDDDSNEITIYNINSALNEMKEVRDDSEKGDSVRERVIFKLSEEIEEKPPCKEDCSCARCSSSLCCGIPGTTVDCSEGRQKDTKEKKKKKEREEDKMFGGDLVRKTKNFFLGDRSTQKISFYIGLGVAGAIIMSAMIGTIVLINRRGSKESSPPAKIIFKTKRIHDDNISDTSAYAPHWTWVCEDNACQKVFKRKIKGDYYTSLSRCSLLCMGPQIWPKPMGYTYYSKELVALATTKLEYKFQSIPSEMVQQYLAEAFKLFLEDLARLERIDTRSDNNTGGLAVKRMNIQLDVESDPDPRLRVNTDESYSLKIENYISFSKISISSSSFCGVRHGLETLGQLILLDQTTGHLITLTNVVIKDAPSYRYRGLMVDTGRNYIPVPDLIRTIDGMATCKLNTFHWRITDSTSFPLFLPSLPKLFEFGAYDRSMVYTKNDIRSIVNRAEVRGIRVLIEVAAPGPVGQAWSWTEEVTCPKKTDNYTCDNVLCLRLKMQDKVFDILEHIYSEIISLTRVDDVFHLSDGVFSIANCFYLIDEREGFLYKALERLKNANSGFYPKLPIVWYTKHLTRDFEARTWERMGVQVGDFLPMHSTQSLSKFKTIYSTKWDLSCEIKKQICTKYRTWQEMYAWNTWRNVEVFSIEGGEATLWTDLVDSGNLDYHIWPRAAAVAERLWSDVVVNNTATGSVYIRLDNHRWRMLLRGIKVQPIWPVWCSFNPAQCLLKLNYRH